ESAPANRCPAGHSDGAGEFRRDFRSRSASPAAVAELVRPHLTRMPDYEPLMEQIAELTGVAFRAASPTELAKLEALDPPQSVIDFCSSKFSRAVRMPSG